MRQRKIKNLDEKLAKKSRYIIEEPEALKGRWTERTCGRPLMMEIGCGKGKFISEKAVSEPEDFWIGVEGHRSVALHALEKCEAVKADNLVFILKYINSLDDMFADGEVSGIFLNFSDPWPKDRHEKRRLTTGKRLAEYARVLKRGGILEFKTDNDGLFEYSLEQINAQSEMELLEMTTDLHKISGKRGLPDTAGPAETDGSITTRDDVTTTEYEEKFTAAGKNINYLKLVRK